MSLLPKKYIHERPDWPDLTVDEATFAGALRDIRFLQGKQLGRLEALGFEVRENTMLSAVVSEVIKSSEIEGEKLDEKAVRSSAARKLGIERGGLVESSRKIDAIVGMMTDATQNYKEPLTEDRLFGWKASLFPAGRSGSNRIIVGDYRKEEMQVVSGALGKETIHFEAPNPVRVRPEMKAFLGWLSSPVKTDPVIFAALAHFRLVTIHPFDDGNGRIARAITDMLLARAENSSLRYYSMSAQIMLEREKYYSVLEDTQKYYGDVNEWIEWFLFCLYHALQKSETALSEVMKKTEFWDNHKDAELNARQRRLVNIMLDGFEGKMRTSKWAKIAKCSSDTALRDIEDLIKKGLLVKSTTGGRSTSYDLNLC